MGLSAVGMNIMGSSARAQNALPLGAIHLVRVAVALQPSVLVVSVHQLGV